MVSFPADSTGGEWPDAQMTFWYSRALMIRNMSVVIPLMVVKISVILESAHSTAP
jgi:hypothetical protein